MLIARDMLLALDPALVGERVGLQLDEWQAQLLRDRPRRALLCCSRQSGKSTVTALLALHTAFYDPGLILVLSPSQRQSAELHRTMLQLYSKIDDAPEITEESALRTTFSTGARMIALPGSTTTTRGYGAVKLAVIDEASRVDDDLIAVVRPMLGTCDGSLIALTTPFGKRGWFYEAWIGDESWTRVRVSADQCPRLSKEFLAEEMRALGPQRFSEEYMLEFLEPDETMFSVAMIDRAFTFEVRPLWH